jgi:hypothetical protein
LGISDRQTYRQKVSTPIGVDTSAKTVWIIGNAHHKSLHHVHDHSKIHHDGCAVSE